MALQLERSHVLTIAMLAGGVALPALTVLLLQLQVMLHMVHKPAEHSQQSHKPLGSTPNNENTRNN